MIGPYKSYYSHSSLLKPIGIVYNFTYTIDTVNSTSEDKDKMNK